MIQAILHPHSRLLDYAQNLIAGISPQNMLLQPAPGLNHPAWLFAHLNVYIPVMENLILNKDFPDPKDDPFGIGSIPSSNPSDYPEWQELAQGFIRGNQELAKLLKERGEKTLEQEVKLERWKESMPKVGEALGYLMVGHQAIHLGQLSSWRRIQGMPPA